jgi:hypothetical protein
MKMIIKLIFFTALLFTYSCKKQETIAYYNGGTAPLLTGTANSGGNNINLSAADSAKTGLSLNWTNPDYKFNYGANTLSVNYLLEIDTAGSNFTNPKRAQVTVSEDTSYVFSENLINSYLANQMGLDTSFTHNLEIRITASINTTGNAAGTIVYSNILTYSAKPFYPPPAVNPPSSGELFLVGSATAGGWNNPVPVPSQQFTQVSATFYTLTVSLTGGQEYLFIPVNGDWSHKFACNKTKSPPNGDSGGVFGYDWNDNFPGPTANGTYKIDVDFQTGKFTVTKQ